MQHREGHFTGLKHFNLYYQCWLPEGRPRAVLLIAHGYAEHSGRYQNVVDHFVPRGYAVYAPDHRGHGRSDGERVQVDDFADYATDLKTFFDLVRVEQPGQKIFLVGHSMGSSIALLYVLDHQDELAGLALSGGGIARPGDPPPPPSAANTPLDSSMLSRDPAVIAAYENDPLVYRGPRPAARASAAGNPREALPRRVGEIRLPVLIMAGTGVPDGKRSTVLHELIGSRDKTLRLYDGLKHEIFNEPEHAQVLGDLEAWLEARL
jgi:acylglycerol lipase